MLGVYEPIMQVLGGYTRLTSRAAEPDVRAPEGQFYHVECYERLVGES